MIYPRSKYPISSHRGNTIPYDDLFRRDGGEVKIAQNTENLQRATARNLKRAEDRPNPAHSGLNCQHNNISYPYYKINHFPA